MKNILVSFQKKYDLNDYQIAQLNYLFSTVLSEISKLLIMGILFRKFLVSYLFALFIMLFLRCTTGGLHFYTYFSCLTASLLYLFLGIRVLPRLHLAVYVQLFILLLCLICCYLIGPVLSKYRAVPTQKQYERQRNVTCSFIFVYALFIYLIPGSELSVIGFWIIVLHTLQLFAAKLNYRKEGP